MILQIDDNYLYRHRRVQFHSPKEDGSGEEPIGMHKPGPASGRTLEPVVTSVMTTGQEALSGTELLMISLQYSQSCHECHRFGITYER